MVAHPELARSGLQVLRWTPWRWAMLVLAAVVLLGAIVTWRVARLADREMRARLLTEARMAERAVDWRRVLSLSGSQADLASTDYRRLKEQLARVRSADPACRFIYLMGRRPDGAIFFFVDSEPPESKDCSPPGQIYDEVPDAFVRTFAAAEPATEGPYSDRWGRWVSGVVPLTDPQTQALIAVLGMDMDARDWNRAIAERCLAPVAVALLIVTLVATFILVHSRDVREKERLAASAAEYRALFDTSRDAIMLLDASGFINCNQATLGMFGCSSREQFVSGYIADWSAPTQADGQDTLTAARQRMAAAFATGGQFFEWMHKRRDGTVFPAEVVLSRLAYRGRTVLQATVRDITERRQAERKRQQMEAQLRQKQKLEAVGALASGMAHEINNPLQAIMGYAQIIGEGLEVGSPAKEYAAGVIAESERVATIVRDVLEFAEQQTQPLSRARVTDMARDARALVEPALREDQATLLVDVPEALPAIVCRSAQVQRVLVNLLTNARDALNARYPTPDERKVISVTGREIDRDGRGWIRITVEDCGAGLAPETAERIFDPFFTTKTPTGHSGLGLAVSQAIARDHGGQLTVESEPERYTRFHLDLPLAQDSQGTDGAES